MCEFLKQVAKVLVAVAAVVEAGSLLAKACQSLQEPQRKPGAGEIRNA